MKKSKSTSNSVASLRKTAEKKLREQTEKAKKLSARDVRDLAHELGTHQIELEMQNEELRNAQLEIEASHRKYADLYDFAPVGYFTFDRSGLIADVNHTGAVLLGESKSLLRGKPFPRFIAAGEDRNVFSAHLAEVLGTQAKSACEIRLKEKNGVVIYARLQSIPAEDDKDGATLIRTAMIDITEQKQAENALRENEERYRSLVELSPDAIAVHCEGEYVYVNPAGVKLFGAKNANDIIGKKVLDLVHPDYRKIVGERIRQTYEQRKQTPLREVRILRLDGQAVDVEVTAAPITYSRKPAAQVVVRDITERKRTEEEIKEGQRFIQKIADTTPNILYIFDRIEHNLVYVNPMLTQILGYTQEEIQKMGESLYKEVIHPEDLLRINELRKQGSGISSEGITEIDLRVRHANGEWRWLNTRNTVFSKTQDGSPKEILGTAQDITERKRAEEELYRSGAILKQAGEMARLGVWYIDVSNFDDLNANPLRWTDETFRIFGYEPGKIEVSNALFFERVHPDDRIKITDAMTLAIASKKPYSIEHRIIRPDGTGAVVQEYADILFDERARPIRIIGAVQDITERKRAEDALKKTHAELERRASELDAVNRELEAFSYTVSHDLKAPLRSIEGFTRALREDFADTLNETGKDYLMRVNTASQRMTQLIDAMLNMARLTRGELNENTVDLSSLAQVVAHELRKQGPQRQVEFIIADKLKARGDAAMLQLVLQNLLENAWKFTSRHATAKIEFGAADMGGRTVYFVRDDGAGFNMDYAEKLFHPFKRLHTESEFPGLGIGLAIAHRIVTRHNGRIWAESAPEKGATFYFTLE